MGYDCKELAYKCPLCAKPLECRNPLWFCSTCYTFWFIFDVNGFLNFAREFTSKRR